MRNVAKSETTSIGGSDVSVLLHFADARSGALISESVRQWAVTAATCVSFWIEALKDGPREM